MLNQTLRLRSCARNRIQVGLKLNIKQFLNCFIVFKDVLQQSYHHQKRVVEDFLLLAGVSAEGHYKIIFLLTLINVLI